MKKKIAFIMSLIMCGSLFTACGSTDDSSSSSSAATTAAASTESKTESETETETEEKTEESTAEDTTAATEADIVMPTSSDEEPASEEHQAAKGTKFVRGTAENGVYHSDYAELTFQTPDGWSELSEQQLLSLMNIGLEITGNQDLMDEELMKQQAIYDYSARAASGANIAVMFQNLKVSAGSMADMITEDLYIETMQNELKNISGVKYSDISAVEKVELCGNIYYRLSQTATYEANGGYSVNQAYYFRKIDDFMLMIILTSGMDCEDMTAYEKNFTD